MRDHFELESLEECSWAFFSLDFFALRAAHCAWVNSEPTVLCSTVMFHHLSKLVKVEEDGAEAGALAAPASAAADVAPPRAASASANGPPLPVPVRSFSNCGSSPRSTASPGAYMDTPLAPRLQLQCVSGMLHSFAPMCARHVVKLLQGSARVRAPCGVE